MLRLRGGGDCELLGEGALLTVADLADVLIRLIEEQRQLLNESRIGKGESGRIEIHVNPAVKRATLEVFVREAA